MHVSIVNWHEIIFICKDHINKYLFCVSIMILFNRAGTVNYLLPRDFVLLPRHAILCSL